MDIKAKLVGNTVKKTTKQLKDTVQERLTIAVAGAFALVIALSWNEFIKEGINRIIELIGITKEGWILKLIAALLTTVICVIGIMIFSKK